MGLAEAEEGEIEAVGVELDLVVGGWDGGVREERGELRDGEVGDADGAGLAGFLEALEAGPDLWDGEGVGGGEEGRVD